MKEYDLKKYLNIESKRNDIILCDDEFQKLDANQIETEKFKIKMLFDIALDSDFIIYFDGRYVIEPYDGLEFKTEEEEFYYNNCKSYIVVVDEKHNFIVRFRIKWLQGLPYEKVYKLVERACNYTKAHPEVSDYKLY